jgi:hypothetical protein
MNGLDWTVMIFYGKKAKYVDRIMELYYSVPEKYY